MHVLYDTRTGNVERFIKKTGIDAILLTRDLFVNAPFILVTYTTGFGDIPATTKEFLEKCGKSLVAVAVSGNRNWGSNYGRAGDKIASIYGVPIIQKFEMSGTSQDIQLFKDNVSRLKQDGGQSYVYE